MPGIKGQKKKNSGDGYGCTAHFKFLAIERQGGQEPLYTQKFSLLAKANLHTSTTGSPKVATASFGFIRYNEKVATFLQKNKVLIK